jgi:hypothetical protein
VASLLFNGTWRCIKFNGQPDTHNHRLTCEPFGRAVDNYFDGKREHAVIHRLYPGRENKGRIVFKNVSTGNHVEYV